MKNNLISAIAGWKSAALLALVAMVAAVAFSGVLTSTSAEAQDPPDATIEQGDSTVTVALTAELPSGETTPTTDPNGSVGTPNPSSLADSNISIARDGTAPATGVDRRTAATATITFPNVAEMKLGDHQFTITGATVTSITVRVIPREAHPGQTVTVFVTQGSDPVDGTGVVYNISADSSADGSFAANAGRSFVVCPDDAATTVKANQGCDVDDTNTDDGTAAAADPVDAAAVAAAALTRENVGDQVGLQVKVADDSPEGFIYITRGDTVQTERVIKVINAPISAELTITPPTPVSISSAANGATEEITATVTTSAGRGIVDVTVVFVTSLGRFTGDCNSLPVCSLKTDENGVATVSLQGDSRAGAATVTVTAGELSGSKDVTFYGKAAALSAENVGGITAINQGGSAFVIFTVTDKDGNPVPDVEGITPKAASEIEGATGVTAAAALYPGATAAETDDVMSCADGTTAAGQCAVEVTATATATRGTHTVTGSLEIPGPPKATLTDSVDVTVAGAPASISHDAPGRIDTLEEIKVSLTVTDDEGDLVGEQAINVTKVEGGGAILDEPAANTANGAASFTFLASSIPGEVVFVVRSGDARAVINVAVGPEPEPVVEEDPEPEAPPATWNNELVSGQNVVVWNGADGADPSEASADGVTAIWSYNTGSGSWDGYFPEAADVPGGNTLTSLSSNQAYVVIVN